jgi:hypothetical protein
MTQFQGVSVIYGLFVRSRSLGVLWLAGIGLLASGPLSAKDEPSVIVGAGTLKCQVFVNMTKDKRLKEPADMMVSWVQGWISASNVSGANKDHPQTVGGSLSPETLEGFLVTECEKHPSEPVFIAANNLYEYFTTKGL